MALLSIFQQYADNLSENIQGTGLETAFKHKWSVLAGTVALYAAYKYVTRPRNLPPGPRGWPIVGSLFDISKDMHLDCMKFSEKYKSDIVSFYVGKQLNVVLNSADAVKLAFAKSNEFSGRDETVKIDIESYEMLLGESYSEEWKKFKTLCMSSLKTHGFATTKSEENMRLQLSRVISHLENLPDNTIDFVEMKDTFGKAGACVIMKIVANKNYEFDDPELEDFLSRVKAFMDAFSETFFAILIYTNVLPRFIFRLFKSRIVKKMRITLRHCREFFLNEVKDHKATLDVSNSRDFIDDILIGNMRTLQLSEYEVADTCFIFAPDATDSTSTQLCWVLFYICWHPEVQEQMVKEIKSVCGDNPPGLKDRKSLVYCEAVILESLRLSTIFSFAIAHVNKEDAHLRGYFIPKNTVVQANLYAVHYDESTFPEAKKFKPSRFISPEGKLANFENVLPFGAGTRKCLGEPLTKSQVFFYITGLVQRFELSFPEGRPDTMESNNLYRHPPAFKMKFTVRY